jgi:transcriptional regulator with XRE-family HTH domain
VAVHHPPINHRSSALGDFIAHERQRRGLVRRELADLVRRAARQQGVILGTTEQTVERWERGQIPQAPTLRALAVVLEVPVERLVQLSWQVDEVPDDDSGASATLDLARRFTVVELDGPSLDVLDDAVHRLARAYSTTVPTRLLPQVQTRLTQVDDLLQRRVTVAQHTRLLVAAGWLHLLLAALHYDLGQREPAHIARDAALYLGEQAHDSEIVGWAWETPAWFALTEGRPQDAIDFADRGRAVASQLSGSHVQNTMKVAVAHAQLGDRLKAERTLEEAAAAVAAMPVPEYPDHHFVFDPPKLNHYASQLFTWLNVPELVEEHAREVLRQAQNPRWRTWVPSRVANVRLDLAQVLLSQGRLDEASDEAVRSLEGLIRHDTLVRAGHVSTQMEERYPAARESRDFRERLNAAREVLYRGPDPA